MSRFDTSAYRIANDRITNLIKAAHDWENTEGFIADGVICPDEYEKQPLHILCILAESYGYDGDKMTSIELQPIKDILGLANWIVKTPRNLAAMLWLLQSSFEQRAKADWDHMPKRNRSNVPKFQTALSKVAWINVKKASNPIGTVIDRNTFLDHAFRNKDILREQIKAISPDLIIVCGEAAFRALHEMKLLGAEVMLGRKWQLQAVSGGPCVIEVSHPRNWWSNLEVYQHFEDIYNQLSNIDEKPSTKPSTISSITVQAGCGWRVVGE